MLKHIYLIFVATFLFGLITGSLFFMSSHMDKKEDTNFDITNDSGSGYVVTVYGYGGCERIGCPLYHLSQDGEYVFLASDGTRYTGSIDFDARREIGSLFEKTNLSKIADTSFTGECPVAYDGVAYTYDITYKGATYHLDSCKQELSQGPVFPILNKHLTDFVTQYAH